jgi:hypothetical protein
MILRGGNNANSRGDTPEIIGAVFFVDVKAIKNNTSLAQSNLQTLYDKLYIERYRMSN